MELYTEPIINTHTYNEILDEINQQREIFDPVIIGGTATDLGIDRTFVFTVTGDLTDGTFSAPTLEATGTETVNELKARVRTANTSGAITITVKKNTVSIGTITIAQDAYTGTTTVTDLVTLIKNDQMDMDITDAGTGSADLSVFVRVK
jgi:hypothetical protein